jgi:hypothetical protein
MADAKADTPTQLLLAEYDHLTDSLKENETMGERRLQFLFTLVTATLGGIAALLQLGTAAPSAALALLGAFVLLFLFGIVTLERIVKRNLATDRYIDGLNRIRAYVIAAEGTEGYRKAFAFYHATPKTREHPRPFSLRPGGLAQGTAVINTVVAGVAFGFGASLAGLSAEAVFGGAVTVGVVAWLAQWLLVRERYSRPAD